VMSGTGHVSRDEEIQVVESGRSGDLVLIGPLSVAV